MNRRLLACAAWLVSMASANASNTWYVDASAVPPGTGTPASPYTSIQYAATRPTTLTGDTLLVAPGTYVGNLNLDGPYIHVVAIGGPEITVIQPTAAGNTVRLVAGTLDGFTILPPIAPGPCCITAAVFIYSDAISHCIVHNPGAISGTGVWIEDEGDVTECTITGFQVGIQVNNFGSPLFLQNSIVTGNTYDVSFSMASAPNVLIRYCAGIANIDANVQGYGNLAGDVGFWAPPHADLHLRPGSMCIDAGNPASPLDPDGTRRDIGALTYHASYAPPPTAYCSGKSNSQGCVPSIGASGSASASSGAPFTVSASNEIPGKVGILLVGLGKLEQPFQGGLLCIQSPIKRAEVQLAGGAGACGGTYAFDMNAYIASGAHPGLVPGVIAHGQWLSRDPLDPAGFGSGLSNALAFGVAP